MVRSTVKVSLAAIELTPNYKSQSSSLTGGRPTPKPERKYVRSNVRCEVYLYCKLDFCTDIETQKLVPKSTRTYNSVWLPKDIITNSEMSFLTRLNVCPIWEERKSRTLS